MSERIVGVEEERRAARGRVPPKLLREREKVRRAQAGDVARVVWGPREKRLGFVRVVRPKGPEK